MTTTPAKPHLLILASAGSGKTYQLVRRYDALLQRGADPSRILATTFTRKAAGEVLERVLDDLCKEAKQGAAGLHRLALVARSLDRLSICTLDSFFSRFAQGFRFELGLPLLQRVIDEHSAESQRLRLEAVDAVIGRASTDDNELQTLITLMRQVHFDDAAQSVVGSLDRLVDDLYGIYLEAPLESLWSALPIKPTLKPAELAGAVAALRDAQDMLPKGDRWSKAWARDYAQASLHDWEGFLGGGLSGKIASGEETYYKQPISPELLVTYEPLVAHAKAWLHNLVAHRTRATYHLLDRFHRYFDQLRDRQGLMHFNDLTRTLSQAVEHRPELFGELVYRLDSRVEHLLLDEFQDTSWEQWRVLEPLAEEVLAYNDQSRTFFCVGDKKQAIYGWRGGSVEVFDHIRDDLGQGRLGVYPLSESFRSAQVVLDTVNQVFGTVAQSPAFIKDPTPVGRFAADFNPHTAHYTHYVGHVTLQTSPTVADTSPLSRTTEDDEDNPASTDHLTHVAQCVAQWHRESPTHDIGVLVKKGTTGERLLYELRRLGVPAVSEAGVSLHHEPSVAAVLSLLKLCEHPGDSAAAYHVLHCPLAKVVGLLDGSRDSISRVTHGIRVAALDIGLPACIGRWTAQLAPYCDQRALWALESLVKLAERYDATASLRPGDFVRFVETTGVEPTGGAPVRVMTIHKSKGLDFDTVVLPELHPLFRVRASAWADRDPGTGRLLAVHRAVNKDQREMFPELKLLAQTYEQGELYEELCVLYVAMTRARFALHMIVPPIKRTKAGPGAAGWSNPSFATMVRRALCGEEPDFEGPRVLYEAGDPRWHKTMTGHAQPAQTDNGTGKQLDIQQVLHVTPAKQTGRASRSWVTVSPSSLAGMGRVSVADLLGAAVDPVDGPDLARLRGTLFHKWFETVGFTDDPSYKVADDASLAALAHQVVPGLETDTLNTWLGQFRRAVTLPCVQQALRKPGGMNEVELWQERPFAVRIDNRLLRGSFDRVVIQRQSNTIAGVWLIDFKTDNPDDLENTIDHYRPQIDAYRKALAVMLHIPLDKIHASLLFVAGEGRHIPLEPL
ncbi:MAG: AAA family ATPase [Phycisphaera sp.]|nr:AAA family ATPase [Phycisphaera sp.]